MALTEERRNEIAYLYVVNKVKNEGISNFKANEIKRQIGNTAKELGISPQEAQEFVRGLVLPLIEEAFPAPK